MRVQMHTGMDSSFFSFIFLLSVLFFFFLAQTGDRCLVVQESRYAASLPAWQCIHQLQVMQGSIQARQASVCQT